MKIAADFTVAFCACSGEFSNFRNSPSSRSDSVSDEEGEVQWVGTKPPQPKTTHLLVARTPVHEDGGRDHDAPVVTAEKVVIARQKARALTVSSEML